MPIEQLPSSAFPKEEREIVKETRKEWREHLTKRKLAEAAPGETVTFTGAALEGVHYASMLSPEETRLHRAIKKTEDVAAAFFEKTGMMKEYEPSLEQEVAMRKVVESFNDMQAKFGRQEAEYPEHDLYAWKGSLLKNFQGADTFLGNKILLKDSLLRTGSVEQVASVFAHEFSHSQSVRSVKKTEAGTLSPQAIGFFTAGKRIIEGPDGVTEVNQPGSTLLIEGVTDLLAEKAMRGAGFDLSKVDLGAEYAPYRQVMRDMAKHLGEGDYDKGLDYLMGAYVTGKDESLISRINEQYAEQGGYPAFIDLLNHLSGNAGGWNALEQGMKSQLRDATTIPEVPLSIGEDGPKLPRIQLLPLTSDRHFKKLSAWVNAGKRGQEGTADASSFASMYP